MLFKRQDFQLLDRTVLGRAIFQPPFKANSALENEARFVHVIHGNSRLYAPTEQLNLHTGDSLVMRCENFVNNWLPNEPAVETPNEVIVLQLYPEVLSHIYNDQLPDFFAVKNGIKPKPVEKIPPNPLMDNFISGLRYYFENPQLISDELMKIKIKELLFILTNSENSAPIQSILSDLFQPHEYEFKEIIHAHLFEDLSIQDLAFFAGLSLSSFKRKFKTVFGTSPGQYIKTKRLEKAKSLLEKTNHRISEIAFDCGFNDLSYFSKSFTAAYHLSPSEYRKKQLS